MGRLANPLLGSLAVTAAKTAQEKQSSRIAWSSLHQRTEGLCSCGRLSLLKQRNQPRCVLRAAVLIQQLAELRLAWYRAREAPFCTPPLQTGFLF
jgi:hypothetical protein